MIQIVNEQEAIEKRQIDDVQGIHGNGSNLIFISEEDNSNPCAQDILVAISNYEFSWRSFYVKGSIASKRTIYCCIKDAVESRLRKGRKVFVLGNKKELKDIIKHR
jgi:hypothetical protein